ncbi:glutathione-dependent formaldehyde-activating enzyme [Hypoxylon crocopeplum]|nr:glutathione-dependent formaldehyde-activating enzyme [Hypoxylon crocopeplum]
MAEQLKTYRGSCHCGTYIYEAKVSDDAKPHECNCSMCYRKNILWFAPKNENIHFVKGDPKTMTNYTFGRKTWDHKFCPNCGVQLLVIGYVEPPQPGEEKEPMTGVNVRSFQPGQGIDVRKMETTPMDGKSWGAPYEPTKYTGPEPKAVIEGGKLYTGSCHCGAVTVALKSKPLDKTFTETVTECNCSICSRLGTVWLYPLKEQVEIQGEDNLKIYLFGSKLLGKSFCKTCGTMIHNQLQPVTEEQISKMPEAQATFIKGAMPLQPINLRVFNDLNVKDMDVGLFDGYNIVQPRYVEP